MTDTEMLKEEVLDAVDSILKAAERLEKPALLAHIREQRRLIERQFTITEKYEMMRNNN